MVFRHFSLFFIVFVSFLLFFAALNGLGWYGDGRDGVRNGWDAMILFAFSYMFRGSSTDLLKRMKKNQFI